MANAPTAQGEWRGPSTRAEVEPSRVVAGLNRIVFTRWPALPDRVPSLPVRTVFTPPELPPPPKPRLALKPTAPLFRRGEPRTFVCSYAPCGVTFTVKGRTTSGTRHFCSRVCRQAEWISMRAIKRREQAGPRVIRFCKQCEAELPVAAPGKAYRANQRYCSATCREGAKSVVLGKATSGTQP